jgi:hypothetical protein
VRRIKRLETMMMSPTETSIFYWYSPVPEYELQSGVETPQGASESSCTDTVVPAAPRLVLTGYRWVAHPVFLTSPNLLWDLEVKGRVEKADADKKP